MDMEEPGTSSLSTPAPATKKAGGRSRNRKDGEKAEDNWALPKKVCRVTNTPPTFSVSTTNTYSILSDSASGSAPPSNLTIKDKTKKKPPPIVVSGVTSAMKAVAELKAAGFQAFEVQKTRDGIRIFPATLEIHGSLTEYLRKNDSPFHTYSTSNGPKNRKFVIYDLDIDHDVEEIRVELVERLQGVLDVRRLQRSDKDGRKQDLPLILVTTSAEVRLEEILRLHTINFVRFSAKPYRGRRGIVQCHRCQQFGHTKNHCGRAKVCVRCAGPHTVAECPRATAPIKCANCGETHVASFTGCSARKIMQERLEQLKKKIGLRSKTDATPTKPQQSQTHDRPLTTRSPPTQTQSTDYQVNSKTYSDKARYDNPPPWVENIMKSIQTLTDSTNRLLNMFTDLVTK